MKPFNLEKALAGKPVVTRSGKPARIVCTNRVGKDYPLVVLIQDGDGEERPSHMTIEGFYLKDKSISQYDLFMASTKKKGWVNLYYSVSGVCSTLVFNTYEDAELNQNPSINYIGISEVEWEE